MANEINTSVSFVIETIRDTKKSMLQNGCIDEKLIYATCNKLSDMLSLELNLIVDIFEKV